MNIKYKLSLTMLALLSLYSMSYAQGRNDTILVSADTVHIEPLLMFEPTVFSHNMYVEGAMGSQILFSKNADMLQSKDRFTPAYSLALGKWFTPFWGLRFNVQGYELNGYSTVEGLYTSDPQAITIYGNNDPVRQYATIHPDGSYRHFIRYFNVGIDFQFSAFNLFAGYKATRKWDLVPALGLGVMQVLKNEGIPATTSMAFNAELMAKYKFNDRLDINMKMAASTFPDQFEGRIAGRAYENMASISVGVSYYFKKRGFTRSTCPNVSPHIKILEKVDTVYQIINRVDTVYLVKEAPFVLAQEIIRDIIIRFDVKTLNITPDSQSDKLADLSLFLKDNPSVEVRIVGHTCDLASDAQNRKLGMERALVVKQKMMDLGAPEDQLITESKSFEEPVAPNNNEENRAKNRRVEIKVVH